MLSSLILFMRTLQKCSKFSKRSLKRQNLAILEAANFAKRFIQTSLMDKSCIIFKNTYFLGSYIKRGNRKMDKVKLTGAIKKIRYNAPMLL